MLGLFTPILLLQAFCVYHAYRNNVEQRWYWLILFLPLFGCIIYLVQNFNSASSIKSLEENVKAAVISNYKTEQLEKALRFSDSVKNKISLADEYVIIGRYVEAIQLYESSLQGFMSDDPSLRMKLLSAHFMNEDYGAAVQYGDNLKSETVFKNSEVRVTYAWSIYQTGQAALAETIFADMDKSFSNYYHRLEYCKFLIKIEKVELAKEKLTELMQEFDHVKGPERRLNRETFSQVKDLHASYVRS
ncbi:MAG TPA: hypothetical protein VIU13_03545 [Chryseolinea sp.]